MAKKKVEPKKVVIFIVEGSSDKKALEKIFQKIYKGRNIVFKFTDGASWRFIKEGLHSLERHTNLHIYFEENPYQYIS